MELLTNYSGPLLERPATSGPPLGPGFTAEEASRADRLEVWVTTAEEDVDFTEFRLMKGDRLIGIRRIKGF